MSHKHVCIHFFFSNNTHKLFFLLLFFKSVRRWSFHDVRRRRRQDKRIGRLASRRRPLREKPLWLPEARRERATPPSPERKKSLKCQSSSCPLRFLSRKKKKTKHEEQKEEKVSEIKKSNFFSFSEVEEKKKRVQSLESRWFDDDDDDDVSFFSRCLWYDVGWGSTDQLWLTGVI